MWPAFCLIIPGRKAFSVQKCDNVLTAKVLYTISGRLKKTMQYELLNLSRRQVENELRLHDPRVVDDNGRLTNLWKLVYGLILICRHMATDLFDDGLGHSFYFLPFGDVTLVVCDVVCAA